VDHAADGETGCRLGNSDNLTNEKAYEDHEAAPYMKQFRAAIAQTGKGNLYDQRIYKLVQ
jgi:hypothetical protein